MRKSDVHTGVDLYCELGTEVVACEDGLVVLVDWFTGKNVKTFYLEEGEPTAWWNDTWGVLIEVRWVCLLCFLMIIMNHTHVTLQGPSGVINYGEIEPAPGIVVGEMVQAGQVIGRITTAVLRSNKGRPMVSHNA